MFCNAPIEIAQAPLPASRQPLAATHEAATAACEHAPSADWSSYARDGTANSASFVYEDEVYNKRRTMTEDNTTYNIHD